MGAPQFPAFGPGQRRVTLAVGSEWLQGDRSSATPPV